jgi:hypothetical protein
MSSQDNFTVPLLQEDKDGKMYFNKNASTKDKESMRFNSSEDAEYFAEHYKEIAPMMRTFRKGGKIKYDLGGSVALGSMAGQAALSFIPQKKYTDMNGNELGSIDSEGAAIGAGALKGASAGAMLGPWGMAAGALIGGGMGYINQQNQANEMGKVKRSINDNIKSQTRLGGPNTSFNNISTNNDNMYAHGGVVTEDQPGAVAELELQEQMQLPDGTVMGVDGPPHEQGGIEVNVPEGTRVFSDKLKMGNKTFAKHAKSINNRISKLDKLPDTQTKKNTQMLFDKQLDGLFQEQETVKQEAEMKSQKKMFSNGGTIPSEQNGMIPATNVRIMKWGGLTEEEMSNHANLRAFANGGLTQYPGNRPRTPGLITVDNQQLTPEEYVFYLKNVKESHPMTPAQRAEKRNGFVPTVRHGATVADVSRQSRTLIQNNELKPNAIPVSNFSAGKSNAVANAIPETPRKTDHTGTYGAISAAVLSNIAQQSMINRVKTPRTLAPIYLSAGPKPEMIDLSNERATIDAAAAGARYGVRTGSGSYSTQASNLQKIRNEELAGKGRSFQTQSNANVGAMNSWRGNQATASNQSVQANLGIDQTNLENLYNYDLWKTGNRMKATGSMGDTMGNVFNNMTGKENQLAYWDVMRKAWVKHNGTGAQIADTADPTQKKYGGTIKNTRSLRKK